jgi:hypothetical protein
MKRLSWVLTFSLIAFAGEVMATEFNREWRFRATLDGDPIGHHHFFLRNQGEERVLTSEADFEVKLLFVKVYEYDHIARERWTGDCLKQIDSTTNDNGSRYTVAGSMQTDSFTVNNQQGRSRLRQCIMSFAYWNPAMLQQDLLLNPQTGEYVGVSVSPLGKETFSVGNRQVAAEKYLLLAEGNQITLWYSVEGRQWLGLETITEDGYKLRYELEDFSRLSLNRTKQ